jgi:AcrR family transcriptional regulator
MSKTSPLSRSTVLQAGVALADEDGIESLSMRSLANRLGVEAMSLYNHVRNKEDLLAGMVEVVVSEFGSPATHSDWRCSIRPAMEATRGALLAHPWAAPLVQSHVAPSEIRMARAEAIVGVLRRAGFSNELAYRAQLTIESFVYGFVLHEVNWPFEPPEQGRVAEGLKAGLAAHSFPYLFDMLGWIATTRNTGPGEGGPVEQYQGDFEFGATVILDGLELMRIELGVDDHGIGPQALIPGQSE